MTYPPIQNYCEIPNLGMTIPKKGTMTQASTKNNIPALYSALRSAKTKGEAIKAFRQFVVWNDIPGDLWEKLEEWTQKKA